jgi:hypothetical protein
MSEEPTNNESDSKVKEVFIVKRSTKMDSDDYVSIQLKSSDDTIEELLCKAMDASVLESPPKSSITQGVQ